MIDVVTLDVSTSGGGSGTKTDTVTRHGRLLAIGLDYHASADAGTDVTVSVTDQIGPALTLLAVSNSKTDGWFYPRAGAVTTANVAITGSAELIPFYGKLQVDVAQAGGALSPAVRVTLFIET